MEKKQNITGWIMSALAVLLSLTLLSTWLLSSMYARYTTQASGEDSARVAVFGENVSIVLNDNITETMVPGMNISYTLKVSNAQNGKTSEVAQNYKIEVVTSGNLPLKYTLTGTSGDEEEIGEFTESSSEKTHAFIDNNMQFAAGKSEEHQYTLNVVWPENANSASLAGIPDFIRVNINVEQTD